MTAGQRVVHEAGYEGVIARIRKGKTYALPVYLIRLPSGVCAWAWESELIAKEGSEG